MLISREFVLFKHLGAQDKISFLQKTWFFFFFFFFGGIILKMVLHINLVSQPMKDSATEQSHL